MIVLDCSAALAMAQGTPEGKSLRAHLLPQEAIIAPSLFTVEAANASWKYVHAGLTTPERAKQLMQESVGLVDEFVPMEELMTEAFAQAVALNHSVYDMVYLVLARRNDATLMTCDRKLQDLCRVAHVNCVETVDL